MTDKPTQIWSCGGGVQSAAIGAAIIKGILPKPDIAFISDTSREASTTWDYLDNHLQPALDSIGVEVHRVPHSYATVDLFSGKEGKTIVMPMHSSKGGASKLPSYCSNEWKVRTGQRWLREKGIRSGHMWIGFSTDEMQRLRTDSIGHTPVSKYPHRYVLIEQRMSRDDCLSLALEVFGVMPPRSSCWMCPNRSPKDWEFLKKNAPADFDKAVELEKEMQKSDPEVWLSGELKPLNECNFNESQSDMFEDDCNDVGCFT